MILAATLGAPGAGSAQSPLVRDGTPGDGPKEASGRSVPELRARREMVLTGLDAGLVIAFGSSLNVHPHYHLVVLDGVSPRMAAARSSSTRPSS